VGSGREGEGSPRYLGGGEQLSRAAPWDNQSAGLELGNTRRSNAFIGFKYPRSKVFLRRRGACSSGVIWSSGRNRKRIMINLGKRTSTASTENNLRSKGKEQRKAVEGKREKSITMEGGSPGENTSLPMKHSGKSTNQVSINAAA